MNEIEKAIVSIETALINSHKIGGWEFHEVRHEPLITALFALQKQMPKEPKPLKYQPLLNASWGWECPACGLAVGENKNDIDITQEDAYCPSCGQALKWSDAK